jgi:predicted negative regulator of RcsB-dependent stress response
MRITAALITILITTGTISAAAQESANVDCLGRDTLCLFNQLESSTATITEERWRDQTYRELAKLLASSKETDRAIAQLEKIQNPDTKALTIRGIGMNAADTGMSAERYDDLFIKLRAEAEKIDHPPSYAIALTYIAMAQAFAADDKGAMKTAMSMENDALRNKALGESAEIQAERGNLQAAMESITAIDDAAFQDKAFGLVSKIFANQGKFDESYQAAKKINNDYQNAQAILYLLAKQITPEEARLK